MRFGPSRRRSRVGDVVAPVLLAAGLLGGWEAYARLGAVDDFILPAPTEIAEALWHDRALLVDNLPVTAQEVGLGVLVALVLGFGLAVALHFSATLRRGTYPLLVASQAVPIVIIAPLLVVWFGFGILPKLAIIALVCFFPVVVTTLDALAAVDPDQLKLLRTLDASRWQAFRWAEAPAALPAALSGAQDRRRRRRHRRRVRRVRRLERGARPPHAAGHPPARDAARLRRRRAAGRVRRGPLLRPRPGRAPARALGPPPTGRTRSLVTRRPFIAVLALAAALVLAACGERTEPTGSAARQSVRLMLDYFPNADHAGIYAAQGTGAFDRAGLDVDIQAPSDPAAPLKLLAAGRVDLAVSYEPELLLARDKGQKLVAVGALVQKPLTSIISIGKRAIAAPEELKGKTVGTAGIPYQSAYLKAILEQAGVEPSSVREVNVGFNLVPAMMSKKVDATLGAFWNYEGDPAAPAGQAPRGHPHGERRRPHLRRAGRRRPRVRPAGERREGAALHARARAGRAGAAQEPEQRRRPAAARQPRPRATPADGEREGDAARLLPRRPSKPFGWMNVAEWNRYATWMSRNRLLRNRADVARALTNEFLPGEGV